MNKNTLIACRVVEVRSLVGLVNTFGGAIIGYNSGIVSGMSLPFITCTLFDSSDNINVSLYQGIFTAFILVFAAIGSPLGVYIQKKWSMKGVVTNDINHL